MTNRDLFVTRIATYRDTTEIGGSDPNQDTTNDCPTLDFSTASPTDPNRYYTVFGSYDKL